jgi:flagellin-like protein
MNFRKLLNDDDAVSPVIGVILMVAITVILAAVIASFVLGLGDQNNPAPTADFEFDYDSDEDIVTVTHGNGDELEASNIYIRGQSLDSSTFGSSDNSFANLKDVTGTSSGDTYTNTGLPSTISAGQSAYVKVSSDDWVINIVWEDPDSDSTSTLSSDSGPEA